MSVSIQAKAFEEEVAAFLATKMKGRKTWPQTRAVLSQPFRNVSVDVELTGTSIVRTIKLQYKQKLEAEIQIRKAGQNVTADWMAAMQYGSIRVLKALGLVSLARAICAQASVKNFDMVTASHMDWPDQILGGRVIVQSAIGDLTDIRCPPGFQSTVTAFYRELEQTRAGQDIIAALDQAGELVRVICSIDRPTANANKHHRHDDATIRIKSTDIMSESLKYVTLTEGLVPVEEPLPGFVMFAHELIHAVNTKKEYDLSEPRVHRALLKGWNNEEEAITITGWLQGFTNAVRPLSECRLLRELNKPLRWGHKGLADVKAPGNEDEMTQYYGPNWRASWLLKK